MNEEYGWNEFVTECERLRNESKVTQKLEWKKYEGQKFETGYYWIYHKEPGAYATNIFYFELDSDDGQFYDSCFNLAEPEVFYYAGPIENPVGKLEL